MTVPASRGTPSGDQLHVRVREIVADHRDDRGALLPILHAVKSEFACVPREAIPTIADELNLSRAEVHGVASFYRDFREQPDGRNTLRVCRAEACQALGANALVKTAEEQLGVAVGETTADGDITLDEVFCLGNCALGPSASLNGTTYGRVDTDRLASLIATARSAQSPVGQL